MNGNWQQVRRLAAEVVGRFFPGAKMRHAFLAATVVLMPGLVAGCAAVTRQPPLPRADDFVLPPNEIYARYPDLLDYGVSATPWARELYLDVPYAVACWGPPARREMSWWTLGGLLLVRPAYWYWWDKGHYQVGLYYERHLIHGWQPVGVRVELRENNAAGKR